MVKKYAVKDSKGRTVGYVTRAQHKRNLKKISKSKSRNRAIKKARADEQRKKDLAAGLPVTIKGSHSDKTYIITQKPKLTNKQIIEQNKKILSDIEEKRQVAKAQGNRQLEQELSQQYSAITKQSNKAIVKENLMIEKAGAVTQFANLYPKEKGREIVEASGLKKYIVSKDPKIPPRSDSGDNLAIVPSKRSYKYDNVRNLWVAEDNIGSGATFRAESYKDPFAQADERSFFQKVGGRVASFKFDLQTSQEILSEKVKKQTYSSDPFSSVKGSAYFVAGIGIGATKFAVDIITDPSEFAAGLVETVFHPVKTTQEVGKQFITDPAGTIGYFGAQGVAINFVPRAFKKVAGKVQEARFEYKLEKNIVYDHKYLFDPATVDSFGQSKLYYDPNVRAPPEQSLAVDYSIQKQLPKAEVVDPSHTIKTPYETANKVIDPFEVVEIKTPKGEAKFIFEKPSIATELARARSFQEAQARGSAQSGKQTQLPKPTIRPEEFLVEVKVKDISIVDKTSLKEGSFFHVANKKGSGSLGGGAELLLKPLEKVADIFEKFDEGRSKGQTPSGLKASSSISIVEGTTKNRPPTIFVNPVIYEIREGQLATKSEGLTAEAKAEAVVDRKLPDKLLFEPVSKYDLRKGLRSDIKSDTISKSETKPTVALQEEVALVQEPIIAQEVAVVTDHVIIHEPTQNYKMKGEVKTPRNIIFPPIKPKAKVVGGSSMFGFNVAVRRKGKFIIETTKPLRREEAINFGTEKVGRSSAATFKLIPTKAEKLGSFSGRGNLKDFYKKGSLFIEKRGKRIKSKEEKEEITLKGLAALRSGKKKYIF